MADTDVDAEVSQLPSIFDTFLCKDPTGDLPFLTNNGPDQYTAMLRTLQRSADYYSDMDQMRIVERIQFETAQLHMKHEQWQRAIRILIPLWQDLSWRRDGWWSLLEAVDWALKESAKKVSAMETLAAVEWELMNRCMCS